MLNPCLPLLHLIQGDDGLEKSSDSISLECHLNDLRPHTEYTISVVPINQNGMGDPSQEIKVKTYSSAPSDPPSNVTVEATSSTVSCNLICRVKHLPVFSCWDGIFTFEVNGRGEVHRQSDGALLLRGRNFNHFLLLCHFDRDVQGYPAGDQVECFLVTGSDIVISCCGETVNLVVVESPFSNSLLWTHTSTFFVLWHSC